MKIKYFALILFFNYSLSQNSSEYISELKKITDVMVYDVTSPVAAARYYSYINLTAYEILALNSTDYQSFSKFSNFKIKKNNKLIKPINKHAFIYGILFTGSKILPSGNKLQNSRDFYKSKLTSEEISIVENIANHILDFSSNDGFFQLNNLKRYTPKRGLGFWQPTPPTFMSAVEPNWNTMKTFFIHSSDQFLTNKPVPFNIDKGSNFYNLTMEVKNVIEENDTEKNEIAAFWDCNPYAISQIGHIEFGLKQLSPGAHWIGIAGIACLKEKISFEKTILVHTLLSMTLHDSFIACWDEKYRSNRIRPETVINKYFDPSWKPLLQTPPFPEFVSGHSVISTAAGEILTKFFGDKFKFKDKTQNEFNLKPRKYKSFRAAAQEACISRLYGGIHFMDAIDDGAWQGKKVADFILEKSSDHLNFNLK